MPRRVYVQDSVLPFGEDSKHEFKGHRCLSVEELPKWCFIPGTLRRSRKAISRTLNGFLNTGHGGRVYLGVLDDGTVKGIPMSPFQIEHLKISLSDLLSRYTPPVGKSQYKVSFVPVVAADVLDPQYKDMPPLVGPSSNSSDCPEKVVRSIKAHLIRTSKLCWCDKLARDQHIEGMMQPRYIVEITIHQFFYKAVADPVVLQLHPLYEDEEGRCYLRRTASTAALTHQEVAEMTKIETKNHFERVVQGLRRELDAYERLVAAKEVFPPIYYREPQLAGL